MLFKHGTICERHGHLLCFIMELFGKNAFIEEFGINRKLLNVVLHSSQDNQLINSSNLIVYI
jgi:hypothetical protein